ncbi:MAG: FAD:protein FMN transferase [Myxococcota bacterium]|nr:FAD:protein FMN transferase [Myxococcota bacterium]
MYRIDQYPASASSCLLLLLALGLASASSAKVSRQAHLMGTTFTIIVGDEITEARAEQVMDGAFKEVARIESLMSEWLPNSEISNINGNAGRLPTKVSVETMNVLSTALNVSRLSKGAFDPTWACLRGLWSFKDENPRLPKRSELLRRLKSVDYNKIIVSETDRTIYLAESGMALGLGAIAKGYAIDRVKELLRGQGIKNFIIDGGGDLHASGRKPDGPWTVGIRHPRQAELLVEFPIRDRSIVTSGDYERFFMMGSRRYHHILDLKTGMPARNSVSVTILADDAIFADAIATAVFVMGPADGLKLVDSMSGVDAIILAPDGRIHRSARLRLNLPDRWRPN